jgi:hypothetical protein
MTRALAGRGRSNARHEEDVLDVVHGNSSTSTSHISSAAGRLSQRAAWRNVRENKLYPFSMGATQHCTHPSISAPWPGMTENVYVTEVRVCNVLINHIEVTAADIVPG